MDEFALPMLSCNLTLAQIVLSSINVTLEDPSVEHQSNSEEKAMQKSRGSTIVKQLSMGLCCCLFLVLSACGGTSDNSDDPKNNNWNLNNDNPCRAHAGSPDGQCALDCVEVDPDCGNLCPALSGAVASCVDDTDCASNQECVLGDTCVPSSCTCNPQTGEITCSADCQVFKECRPRTSTGCDEPNPAQAQCQNSVDCAEDESCVYDQNACYPSTCQCDAETGTWICTEDCQPGHVCKPEASACQGPNPAEQPSCDITGECPPNSRCMPAGPADDTCIPSDCFCDAETESWVCTADCRPVSVCKPVDPQVCQGPNPAEEGCQNDVECGEGEVCLATPNQACVPSQCSCDAATGEWRCTQDCSPLKVCAEEPPPTCQGSNPAEEGCRNDNECRSNEVCVPTPGFQCVPSGCSCDPATGTWICTDDCLPYQVCAPAPNRCSSPNPAEQECAIDSDCGSNQACVISDADVCKPSHCQCDSSTGSWLCTRDCQPAMTCAPAPQPTCAGPNPAEQECAIDADCAPNEACLPSAAAVCVPSSCQCDAATGSWICTRDCNPPMACQPRAVNPTCTGPNPAADACYIDTDCESNEVCRVSAMCTPSACGCDTSTGQWLCTTDCAGTCTFEP